MRKQAILVMAALLMCSACEGQRATSEAGVKLAQQQSANAHWEEMVAANSAAPTKNYSLIMMR